MSQSNETIEIIFPLDEDEGVASIDALARERGLSCGPAAEDKALAGYAEFILESVLIAGAAVAVAKFVITELDRRKGGVHIDLDAPGRKVVKRESNLPYGFWLITGGGREARIEVHDQPKDWMERLLSQILAKALTTPAQAAAKAIEAGLSADRVKVQPA